jgi:hypothetical protein
MGFETVILNEVAEVLADGNYAEFYNGTLFVGCSLYEAVMIQKRLEAFTPKVQMSYAGTDYVFDFVE